MSEFPQAEFYEYMVCAQYQTKHGLLMIPSHVFMQVSIALLSSIVYTVEAL